MSCVERGSARELVIRAVLGGEDDDFSHGLRRKCSGFSGPFRAASAGPVKASAQTSSLLPHQGDRISDYVARRRSERLIDLAMINLLIRPRKPMEEVYRESRASAGEALVAPRPRHGDQPHPRARMPDWSLVDDWGAKSAEPSRCRRPAAWEPPRRSSWFKWITRSPT